MDDLLTEFLTETSESLAVIDVELVKFEQDPNDAAILGNIFRLVHTIKGTCGFLGLPRLESVAHAGENVLGKFRDGELEVTPEAVTLILRCIDTIRDLLGTLEETGEEPEGKDTDLIAELNAMAEGKTPTAAAPAAAPAVSTAGDSPSTNNFGAPVAAELLAEVEAAQAVSVQAASDKEMATMMEAEMAEADASPSTNNFGAPVAAELLAEVEAAQSASVQAASVQAASQQKLETEMAAERAAEAAAPAPSAPAAPQPPAPKASVPAKTAKSGPPKVADKDGEKEKKESSIAQSSIRVNVDVLEALMTLVSELVLTRNSLLQMVRGQDENEFSVPLQRLSHITSDLQEGVMKTRMQPIGNAWAKLPRIVRDLAVESGKKIDLVMQGAETELDRQVLDLIKDPLTHMVRNSADHGLEDTAGRIAAGKSETGTINLNAFHEGGHIIIEIKDNGRGLNMDRIKDKIITNGVATEAELAGMSDQQIQQFIFKAGFSTAEKVTNVSGRGVGMDVVRTNIEKIGGTIELKSIEGRGTTFTIKIPLTLAIVSALIVAGGGQRFAIPQISVVELVRTSVNSDHAIEMINESPVLRLRNRLLPLVSLSKLLGLGAEEKHHSEEHYIVVSQVGTFNFGIIVDRVFDTEEIVVKPVAPVLREIPFYSGNTILGDGSVIMILDPNGIAGTAGQQSSMGEDDAQQAAQIVDRTEERTTFLVFKAGSQELKAVPLALIARLEEIDMGGVEVSHGQHVVQYRGHLMPLIPFNPNHSFASTGMQPVLVFTDRDRSMALAVDEIVDIVEDHLKIEFPAKEPGLIGTGVIDGHSTDVIDCGYYLTTAFPDWFGGNDEAGFNGVTRERKVLLVDDSAFFRNLLTPLLSVAGWKVKTADSAEIALRLRDRGEHYDVIISDIEMPGMDGFEFAETIRREGSWRDVPMVALSSHASDSDFARGREVGFSDYVAKHDRDALVNTLSQTIALAAGHNV